MSYEGMTFTVMKNLISRRLDDDGMDIALMSKNTKMFLREIAKYICELEEVKQAAISVCDANNDDEGMRVLRVAIKNARGLP